MAEPVGVQVVEAGAGCARVRAARRRAARASARPARRSGTPARTRPCCPRRSSLESPKPTTPRPAYCAASRARVRASSGCRVRLAAMTTAMPRPVRSLGVAYGVEHQVGERGDAAEPGGVPARVDLDLQPPAAVATSSSAASSTSRRTSSSRAQHRPRHVVEALEAEPALLVGRRQLRRPVLDQGVGQVDPVALGQLEQRRVPHRPREVQVQVRLGQRLEVAHSARRPGSGVDLGNHERILGGGPDGPFGGPRPMPVDSLTGGFHMLLPALNANSAGRGGTPEGTSSTGRASVSKTEGWGFKSLVPCSSSQLRNDER